MSDRRVFIKLAAGAIAAISADRLIGAPSRGANRSRSDRLIDVHHHVFPAPLAAALRSSLPEFSLPDIERSLTMLAADGCSFAMISYPSDTIQSFEKTRLVNLLRETNVAATEIVKAHPDRYGLFASLPLPYVEAALDEIAYCYEQLNVDGILLSTSYIDKWLGDAAFVSVLDELNRRAAVVFVHPAAAACCRGLLPGVSDSIIEYETDTARTIASIVFSGAAERCPQIRFIFSHSGGAMPSLIERFTTATRPSPALAKNIPKGALAYLRSFYYDTAQATNAAAMGALLQVVEPSHVMFGTDFPYRSARDQVDSLGRLGLPRHSLEGILADNAERLIARAGTNRKPMRG